MSDLAEHLGLRGKDELFTLISAAGLVVAGKMDIRPRHGKATDNADPLHRARSQEVTSLCACVITCKPACTVFSG
jgi:hypothetical protein